MTEEYKDSIQTVFRGRTSAHLDSINAVHEFMHEATGLRGFAGNDSQQIDSVSYGKIAVVLLPFAEGVVKSLTSSGNLQKDTPNIVIQAMEEPPQNIGLTWEEARRLCAALWKVTNIAEFG